MTNFGVFIAFDDFFFFLGFALLFVKSVWLWCLASSTFWSEMEYTWKVEVRNIEINFYIFFFKKDKVLEFVQLVKYMSGIKHIVAWDGKHMKVLATFWRKQKQGQRHHMNNQEEARWMEWESQNPNNSEMRQEILKNSLKHKRTLWFPFQILFQETKSHNNKTTRSPISTKFDPNRL